jgi:pimeloyl-ACP methyl ester carboxylesterase
MPRIWIPAGLFALLAVLGGRAADSGSLESVDAAAAAADLSAQFDLARERGIGVVDARELLDGDGLPRAGRKDGLWRLNLLPGEASPPVPPQITFRKRPEVIVVFVHGYNTPPARALRYGNNVWDSLLAANDRLRAGSPKIPPDDKFAFFTFLWRGDLGQIWFSATQKAAEASSPSLADLMTTLSQEAPSARTVIIAHSLGAQVALEALKSLCETRGEQMLLDSLVLVQPAVIVTSVYKWTVDDILSQSDHVQDNSGRYADIIRCAGHFLYTYSEKDDTLLRWFKTDEKWMGTARPPGTLPSMPWSSDPDSRFTALGSPFVAEDKLEGIPRIRETDPLRSRDPREAPRMELAPPELGDMEVLFVFSDWRIDHPNAEGVDISKDADKHSEIRNWHSPIFDEAGGSLFGEIWTRVTEGLGAPRP